MNKWTLKNIHFFVVETIVRAEPSNQQGQQQRIAIFTSFASAPIE